MKNSTATLALDAGPAYVWKKVGGLKDSYFAIQFGEKLSVNLAENLTFNQTLTYRPKASDFSNYTLNAAAYVEVDLSSNLSFRTGVTDIYDATPAACSKKNDFILSSGIAIKF